MASIEPIQYRTLFKFVSFEIKHLRLYYELYLLRPDIPKILLTNITYPELTW